MLNWLGAGGGATGVEDAALSFGAALVEHGLGEEFALDHGVGLEGVN